jgi:UDP-glucuronate 4-epimerase
MNILITGAAGFIGSHAAEKLLANGHSVIGIDNFDPFYAKHFKLHNLETLKATKQFSFHEGNILDKAFLDQLFNSYKIDAVIHLAAKAGVRPSIENIGDYYETNITGTVTLLECMKANGVTKMLFASSSSVYGNNEKAPFSEADFVDNPISPYASTKKSGELLCHVYHHLHGFDITCLRFFTVFGPGQRPDLAIHKFTRLIEQGKPLPFFGDGTTARDYTYVDDIVNGIDCALNHLGGFRVYNLGESRVVTLKDLIATIENAMGKKAILNKQPMQPGDVKLTYADISKAKKEIGYNPKFDLATGIRNFVEWYLANKSKLYSDKPAEETIQSKG